MGYNLPHYSTNKIRVMTPKKKKYRAGTNPDKTEGRLVIDRRPAASTKRVGKFEQPTIPDPIKDGEKPLPF
jgi:hypothetical protein